MLVFYSQVLRYSEDVARLERELTALLDKKELNNGVLNQIDHDDYIKKVQEHFQLYIQLKTIRQELERT
ncbi:unnamed protein product [Didymodactylos carnosus]|uniref:Uncharacterized protein n=1 Tax=Didymodactylos carnosus TaxID=1234261 RepID=A0A8S2F6A4_9BILA|nr:unnamed protein product [Didymodactylos carnosus]CAF4148617.1 unnamed protein product [Didymodactylos carnosus]